MIIEKLAKLDEPKRILVAVLTVLTTACVYYLAITRYSLVELQAARAEYTSLQAEYADAENQQLRFLNLQKQFENGKRQLKEQQQWSFSSEQAVEFFENINAMALAYNLKPISRIISEPKKLVTEEKTEPEQQFLETRSAKIVVAGNYFDIVDFVKELTNRRQKVCITNLHIALPAGEKFNPKASFRVTLLIDSSERKEK
jgi:Tfp pilus assembly protein PilO